ncbi:hypothetical protein [Pseudovibrio sp. Ad26]|uniref:hypothetical protein n=1 Tax=Pseudovibrio sp. Ad26 TaxID=989410 RepID=UPI0007AE4650|nr:hypothetical protein [Pseudovibrio sp. Ad26]KZL06675.1 hypothetical protein PsAD26_03932 [Pseudovibrio sp. Ad26]
MSSSPPVPTLTSNIRKVLEPQLIARSGSTSWHAPQPINAILITDQPLEDLMGDIGWYKNDTYTRNHINLFTYIQLALQNLLPVFRALPLGPTSHRRLLDAVRLD